MDNTVKTYQKMIKQVLNEYIDYMANDTSQTEDVMLFDDENKAYSLFNVGWQNGRRIQIMIVLMRIVGDKIYVEEDNTDYDFVERLLSAGIPSRDIVLAWHPPEMRQYTEYAIA